MTEDEAKKKWCPFGRMGEEEMAINREYQDKPVTMCYGSVCMAWRWSEQYNPPTSNLDGYYSTSDTQGHCGLAGKP